MISRKEMIRLLEVIHPEETGIAGKEYVNKIIQHNGKTQLFLDDEEGGRDIDLEIVLKIISTTVGVVNLIWSYLKSRTSEKENKNSDEELIETLMMEYPHLKRKEIEDIFFKTKKQFEG